MEEILSQEEIDALVSSIAHGETDLTKLETPGHLQRVRTYDFKRPNKFSKAHINFIHNLHENYSRALKTYLTAHLHTVIVGKVVLVEQITYDEFIRSLPSPTVLGVFNLKPLEGMFLMNLSTSLSFTIIDRLLGGVGKEYAQNRELTDIEKTVMERRLRQMIDLFKEAWAEVSEVTPGLVALETNPQFTQIVGPNEMIALVTMEVQVGEVYGVVHICLPYMVLEPIMEKLSAAFLISALSRQISDENIQAIRKKIEWVQVELVAKLGQSEILVRDLLDLAPGDVIPLTQGLNQQMPVYVGKSVKFWGLPGLSGERLAIQVTEVTTEVGDENG